jgi:hypothetical protein
LTGTKMDPPKPTQAPDAKPEDKLPVPSDSPLPATTGS